MFGSNTDEVKRLRRDFERRKAIQDKDVIEWEYLLVGDIIGIRGPYVVDDDPIRARVIKVPVCPRRAPVAICENLVEHKLCRTPYLLREA
jgi:hypothetical protein